MVANGADGPGSTGAGDRLEMENQIRCWVPITSGSDWEINSIGWVDGDGRDYLIAVLTAGDPSEANGITTIEDIARHVWDGLAPAARR
jgi:hypothetical protein